MANARLAVDKAVFDALNVAAVLAVAPGGVHNMVAPPGTRPPYVIFEASEKVDEHTFDLRGANMLYITKAVTDKPWPKEALDADTQIDTVLQDAGISVTGFSTLACRRQRAVYKTEEHGGGIWQHVGGVYRVMVDEITPTTLDGLTFVWGVAKWGYVSAGWG